MSEYPCQLLPRLNTTIVAIIAISTEKLRKEVSALLISRRVEFSSQHCVIGLLISNSVVDDTVNEILSNTGHVASIQCPTFTNCG